MNTHPHYLYSDIVNSIKADKATITAMSGLLDGTIAYATDTNEFGTYSADLNSWTWIGAGSLLYVQDEGVPIGTPSTLNFVGDNVSVSISGTVTRIYVTGSTGGVSPSPSFDNFWTSGTQGNYPIRAKNDSTVNAMGNYAMAIGQNSIASGAYSYAQGFQTKAINVGASAEGNLTIASGVNSHAEGNGSLAFGNDSHAEGSGQAFGDTSHAEGLGSKAYGAGSHAEGVTSVASGTYSFAANNTNHALGISSAALGGMFNKAMANNSVVLGGSGTIGSRENTVYASMLNIVSLHTGTVVANLGIDSGGNVVTGTTSSPSGGDKYPFEARLTLETGTPFSTTPQTAKTVVYLTPYNGNQIAVYDGVSSWNTLTLSTDISITITGSTANLPYDVFVYNNSGVLALEIVAWTNGTTRATAITTQNGVDVKSGATTRRLAGTILITSVTGQCEMSQTFCGVSNRYNQLSFGLFSAPGYVNNAANTTYTTTATTFVEINGGTGSRLNFVLCKPALSNFQIKLTASSAGQPMGAIGYDTTTNPNQVGFGGVASAFIPFFDNNDNDGTPLAAGAHYAAFLVCSASAGTMTIFADLGATRAGASQDGKTTWIRGTMLM